MKNIKKYIKKLVEQEVIKRYPMPPEIKDALENKLKVTPIPRYVNNLKAINSIPPSYRIFLHNGQHFDISMEEYSLMVKVGPDEYYIADLDERNYAVKAINRLLVNNILKKQGEEDEDEDLDDIAGPSPMPKTTPKSPTSSPKKPPSGPGATPTPPAPPEPTPEPET